MKTSTKIATGIALTAAIGAAGFYAFEEKKEPKTAEQCAEEGKKILNARRAELDARPGLSVLEMARSGFAAVNDAKNAVIECARENGHTKIEVQLGKKTFTLSP